MDDNYSVDVLKKAAFIHELNNVLSSNTLWRNIFITKLIIWYFEERIKQIDNQYKNK
jgi:hypothetical protein